ncbi:MAG TPA: hypothetical protein VHX65_06360 [Pirellulales bacterium]|jgi:tetratricopeptide (TPR) repeat protein|nr:hypothetical protein [Pirellulales bacterium]
MPAPIRRVDELGFPLPAAFADHPDAPPRSKRTWGQLIYRWRWSLLLLLLPLLFGDSLIHGVRQAIAQRMLRNAQIHYFQNRLPEALASTDRALFWEPNTFDQWEAYQYRALIFEGMPKHAQESFDAWTEVIKRLEDPQRAKQYSDELRLAYSERASVGERIGRHRDAIADATIAVKLANNDRSRAETLNGRAYMRALANLELDRALEDVDESLRIVPGDANVIDTRAYVLFRLGKYDQARKDIDDAIRRLTGSPAGGFWFGPDNGPHIRAQDEEASINFRANQDALAVMYHHRGEIRKKQGQAEQGEKDFRKAEMLGYDPDRGIN